MHGGDQLVRAAVAMHASICTAISLCLAVLASGLVRWLTGEPLDEENGRGGYSAMFGLYSFEETPPHAELLGRMARVAAHVDAPFFVAMTPGFMDVEKKERHPLVSRRWQDHPPPEMS